VNVTHCSNSVHVRIPVTNVQGRIPEYISGCYNSTIKIKKKLTMQSYINKDRIINGQKERTEMLREEN
jgi:hypothetical protein